MSSIAFASRASAELPGDDQRVAGQRAGAAGHTCGAAERGDAEDDLVSPARVAADHGHAGLVQPSVELEHVVQLGLVWKRQRDNERLGVGA